MGFIKIPTRVLCYPCRDARLGRGGNGAWLKPAVKNYIYRQRRSRWSSDPIASFRLNESKTRNIITMWEKCQRAISRGSYRASSIHLAILLSRSPRRIDGDGERARRALRDRDGDSCESDMTVYISSPVETFIARNCALYSPAMVELSAPAWYSRTYYSSGDACNEHDSAAEHKIAKFHWSRSTLANILFSEVSDDLSGPRSKPESRLGGI